jgi:hypothetical protein
MKSYIKVCSELMGNTAILTNNERNAIGCLIIDAKKWRAYQDRTKVKSVDLNAVITYYLDKKEIPKEKRVDLARLLRPAKMLLNKCDKDVSKCIAVIDVIAVEFVELMWTLNACVNHCDRVLNK